MTASLMLLTYATHPVGIVVIVAGCLIAFSISSNRKLALDIEQEYSNANNIDNIYQKLDSNVPLSYREKDYYNSYLKVTGARVDYSVDTLYRKRKSVWDYIIELLSRINPFKSLSVV